LNGPSEYTSCGVAFVRDLGKQKLKEMAMTVEDRATLKAVIVGSEIGSAAKRVGKLLDDVGMDVAQASAENAIGILLEEPVDLLVLDVRNSPANRQFVERLIELPGSARPRQLAIFSDLLDDQLRALRGRMRPTKVHVFLTPLHMHGLLGVLRQLECESQTAGA
jgi:hypothetical protein